MRLVLQGIFWSLGIVFQILVVHALLRGDYKKFFLPFVYSIAVLLVTVGEVSGFTAATQGARDLARNIRLYYWIADAILQVLLFAVVMSLIGRAIEFRGSSPRLRKYLVAGSLGMFVLSYAVHSGPRVQINEWMTLISRDLSFAAAILDLILWFMLIAARRKDTRLLMLSGGLGIQFAGTAVGQSVRYLAMEVMGRSRGVALAGGSLVAISNLLCFYIWWQAFRHPQTAPTKEQAS